MNKIISINISETGILKCQELCFDSLNNAIKVKGENGAGKTTASNIFGMAISGAKNLPEYLREKKLEILIKYQISESIFYLKVKNRESGLSSDLFALDENNKKISPILSGQKITAGQFHDLISTDLSFGVNKFLNPQTRNEFLFGDKKGKKEGLYSKQLSLAGIYFDNTHPEFKGSIIDKINKAVEYRETCLVYLRQNNAHATALINEGFFNTKNEPTFDYQFVEIDGLMSKKASKEKELNETGIKIILKRDALISEAKTKKQVDINNQNATVTALQNEINSIIAEAKNYNSGIESEYQNEVLKLQNEIILHNNKVISKRQFIDDMIDNKELIKKGLIFFNTVFLDNLKIPTEYLELFLKKVDIYESEFESRLQRVRNIETEKSKIIKKQILNKETLTNFEGIKDPEAVKICKKYIDLKAEFNNAQTILNHLEEKEVEIDFKEVSILEQFVEKLKDEIESISLEIEEAKRTNKIISRIQSFYDWINADRVVRNLYLEYSQKLEKIQTGVNGLYFRYNDESKEIELRFNPLNSDSKEYFESKGNILDLPFDNFSEAEKSLITIMLQNYLLKDKKYGIRAIWTEANISNSTFEEIKKLAELYDMKIFCSFVGEFKAENLKENEILIQNGQLIFNK